MRERLTAETAATASAGKNGFLNDLILYFAKNSPGMSGRMIDSQLSVSKHVGSSLTPQCQLAV